MEDGDVVDTCNTVLDLLIINKKLAGTTGKIMLEIEPSLINFVKVWVIISQSLIISKFHLPGIVHYPV